MHVPEVRHPVAPAAAGAAVPRSNDGRLTATSAALTLVGVVLLGVSALRATLVLDGYGLARSLPAAYYAGLAILPVAAVLGRGRGRAAHGLAAAQLVAFVAALWLMPLALEGAARFRTSYANFGFVDALLRGDGLRPDLLVYHNWPLMPMLTALFVRAFDVSAQTVLEWFPFAAVLCYLVPLSALLRTTTGAAGRATASPGAWLTGVWFFVVLNWTGQDYFSPQALAYGLFLCWMAVLAHVALRLDGEFSAGATVAAIGLFAAMVATHMLTPLVALGQFAALSAIGLVRARLLLATTVLMFLIWQAYFADVFFSASASQVRGQLLNGADFLRVNVAARVAGDPAHTVITELRMASTAAAFGLGGLALMWLRRVEGAGRPVRFALACIVGVVAVSVISVYGGEMLIRVFLFSLPALGVLVAAAAVGRRRLWLHGALALLAPVHVLTYYGNELYDHVSAAELRGYEVVARLEPGNVYGGYPAAAFRDPTRHDWIDPFSPPLGATAPSVAGYVGAASEDWQRPGLPTYTVVTRGDGAGAELFYDRPGFEREVRRRLDGDPRFRRVYATREFAIYRREPAAPGERGAP